MAVRPSEVVSTNTSASIRMALAAAKEMAKAANKWNKGKEERAAVEYVVVINLHLIKHSFSEVDIFSLFLVISLSLVLREESKFFEMCVRTNKRRANAELSALKYSMA